MKYKFLLVIIITIGFGAYFGKVVYENHDKELKEAFNEVYNVSFLQIGVYSSKEKMDEQTKNLSNYFYIIEDGKYKIIVGISKNDKIIEKLKKIYIEKGNEVYVRDYKISNKDFLEKLASFEEILELTTDELTFITIEKQIIELYKEMIKIDA